MKKKSLILLTIIAIVICFFILRNYKKFLLNEGFQNYEKMVQYENLKIQRNIKSRLLDKFDYEFYDSLSRINENNHGVKDFLKYSIIVSNKWKSPDASYNVFKIMSNLTNDDPNNPNLSELDEKSKKFSLDFLIIASELGNPNAQLILGNYYLEGRYVKKDTVLAHKLFEASGLN